MSMPEYPFRPITNEQRLNEALNYIAQRAASLAKLVLGRELPLDTLAVYAQSYDEHDFLTQAIRQCGPESPFTHETTLYVEPHELVVRGNAIRYLGVRKPDERRREVGYADFPVDDYEAIRDAENPYVQPWVSARGQELLRLTHPDFDDIVGFVVRADEHQSK